MRPSIAWRRRPARSAEGRGLALRFARVKRYRHDKTATEADTFATTQTIVSADDRRASTDAMTCRTRPAA
jgi:hypothetical protein